MSVKHRRLSQPEKNRGIFYWVEAAGMELLREVSTKDRYLGWSWKALRGAMQQLGHNLEIWSLPRPYTQAKCMWPLLVKEEHSTFQ